MKPRIYLKYGYWLCLGGIGFGVGATPLSAYQRWQEYCRLRRERELNQIYSDIAAGVQRTWQSLGDTRK